MLEFVITFKGHQSLDCSWACDAELAASQNLLLLIGTERLRDMARTAAAKKDISDPTLQPIIKLGLPTVGQGPVSIVVENLGCPRDQMLVAAGYLAELTHFNLSAIFAAQAVAAQQRQELAHPQIQLPNGMMRINRG